MIVRRILTIVLGGVALTSIFCEQSLAEDVPATAGSSQETRTTQAPEHLTTTAPESTASVFQALVQSIDPSSGKRLGPKIKTIGGLRPKGPERARVTIVGRPNQETWIIGEDGRVERLIRRPILVNPSVTPTGQPRHNSNQYRQLDKRQKLREKLDLRPSAHSATASGTVRPRATPTPPPARRRSLKSPQRPIAPVQETTEH